MLKAETFEAPTHWAPALINGDWSGLDSAETHELLAWIDANKDIGSIVSVDSESERFTWNYRIYNPFAPEGVRGGSVCEYTALVEA